MICGRTRSCADKSCVEDEGDDFNMVKKVMMVADDPDDKDRMIKICLRET